MTDVQIHVFSASLWRIGQPKRLLASLAPGTVIEPRQHFSHEEIQLAGERLWVSPAYQGMLREAVAATRALRRAAGPAPA